MTESHAREQPTPQGLAGVRAELSDRELEIIELVATGLTNSEIAGQLMISKRTVESDGGLAMWVPSSSLSVLR